MSDIRLDPMESETGINAPPPFAFMAAILTSILVNWIIPLHFGLPTGVRLAIAGALVLPLLITMPLVLRSFHKAGAEFDVTRLPTALVTDGPFRLSRNPAYVAFFLLFIGLAFVLDNVWGIFLVVGAMVFVHYKVVLREEAILETQFGSAYLEYKGRVRRWI